MRALTLLLLATIFVNNPAWGCEENLKSVLKKAENQVKKSFSADEPCYKAAMIGRRDGPPGCFPPRAFDLQSALESHVDSAKNICRQVCRSEAKHDECLSLLSLKQLKNLGLQGIQSKLSQGLSQKSSTLAVPQDITPTAL